jgi:crotonobetainyl-CoA:carnitine CoA-transferase CaiB-like acyl-CoA transferase
MGLAGLRVLEFPDPKSALCGRLLADLGADVVLVEPPGGHNSRSIPPFAGDSAESLFFWFFNANKRSITLDLDDEADRERFLDLVSRADVVLDPFAPGHLAKLGLDEKTLLARNPNLILTSITAFGQTGPYRDYVTSDIVGWALGGIMGLTGDPDREPLTAPAMQAYQTTALWALMATQAAVYKRRRTGLGSRIDISVHEAIYDMSEAAHTFYLANGDVVKRNSGQHPLACPFMAFKAADGYAFVGLSARQQWTNLAEWMRSDGMLPDEVSGGEFATIPVRLAHREEVNSAINAWASTLTKQELFIGGAERGIPNAPLQLIDQVLDDEQLRERGYFVALPDPREDHAGESHPSPGLPYRTRAEPEFTDVTAPPRAGEHSEQVAKDWATPSPMPASSGDAPGETPLEGLHVVDMCWNMAGPMMGRILGDFGATVVKIEPREIGDPVRMIPPHPNRETTINGSYTYQDLNRDKLGMTLDTRKPQAQGLFLEIAKWSDVILENFTAGTMDRMRLGYDLLSSTNPRLILGSLCGYGQTGTRRTWPSYHPTSAALSGLFALFAYPGGPPLGFGHSHMDYMAGIFGAIGVLDALLRREDTGTGAHVDISQLESGVILVGPQALDYSVNGVIADPEGNQAGALGAALQGCYRASGDDRWVVVSAPGDSELQALGRVVGAKDGAAAGIEDALRDWMSDQDAWDAFHLLQKAGVPAGVVSHGPDLLERDEQLKARGMMKSYPHPEIGNVPIVQPPVLFDGKRPPVRAAGPVLGQHTEQVLRELLGLSEEQYLDYILEDVI